MHTHTTETTSTAPRLYVGTYAKYNAGSIKGAWLDLEDYANKDEFLTACRELHKDEADPELMFQDFEGFPRAYYSESSVSDELFDWLEMDEHDRELLEVYLENIDQSGTIEQARDAFIGRSDGSKADFIANWYEETGGLEGIPEHLANYIDFEALARDSDFSFVRHNGELWVFS